MRRESMLTASRVMVEPRAVIFDHQGPRAALHAMRSNDSPAAIVIDVRDRYVGVLTLEQAQAAAKARSSTLANIANIWNRVSQR